MSQEHLRVLITTDWYTDDINGVVTSVVNLKNELERMGHEVMIVTLAGQHRSRREGNTIYIGSLSMDRLYTGAKVRLLVKDKWIKQILDFNPDIVHSQCEFSTFSVAKRIAKELDIPLVHTYHTIYEDYAHYLFPSKRVGKLAAKYFSRRALSKVDRVITPTDKIKALLQGYDVKSNISIVPSGLVMDRFYSTKDTAIRLKKSDLGIAEDTPVLLFVGRIAKEKNLAEICEYLTAYKGKKIAFLIVGDGPERKHLEEIAERTSPEYVQYVFTGLVDPLEVPAYYKISDLFVSASQSETQGLTYIEAAASGLPLLCRADDCLENVIEQSKNGWEYHNEEEFMHYLRQFLKLDEEDIDQMAEISAEKVGELDIKVVAPKVMDIYESLIEEK